MKKFVFRLQALLTISLAKKDKAESDLRDATQFWHKQVNLLKYMKQELDKGLAEYEDLLQKKSILAGMMTMYTNFFIEKRRQINLQTLAVRKAAENKALMVKKLLEISKKVQALEQLRDIQYEEYRQALLAEEQKQIDEIGLQTYMRKQEKRKV